MMTNRKVAVYGAYGHTGRFVVSELLERSWDPRLCGRDVDKLKALAAASGGLDFAEASTDVPASLDRALLGAAAVINCAGPFARTAEPMIEAALRAPIPYLDIGAEIEVVVADFERYSEPARRENVIVLPAMAFYGGLGDLLATAAMHDWTAADELSIAYALSSWQPTRGTRATIAVSTERRNGRRVVFSDSTLRFVTGDPPMTQWTFPEPLGAQPVVGEFTTADTVLIAHHLKTAHIRSFMTTAPLSDLSGEALPSPAPSDQSQRSSQTFLVEVVARLGSVERRAIARGRDIYAISAPLVVEAMRRVLTESNPRGGVFAPGELFDSRDFLTSLAPDHLVVDFSEQDSSKTTDPVRPHSD